MKRSRTGLLGALVAGGMFGCGAPPQRADEAAVTFRAAFSAEQGVVTRVIFPWIADGAAAEAEAGLTVSDGGTAKWETTADGLGLALEGKGFVEASYSAPRAAGLGNERGIPEAQLTRGVPDAGTAQRYVQVNKGGAATAAVEFEYTASRDCGGGCGGKRGWTFDGPVGLSRQEVSMTFTEAKAR